LKNYIGFVNDHSGSMAGIANAAIADYNANITATKNAASREMLDTVVSVVGVGIGNNGYGVKRQVVISNPHVLRPVDSWSVDGGTPLWDGIGDMINLLKNLPDANDQNVSFLVLVTTDGDELHSRIWTYRQLSEEITRLQKTGRWTFVFRVPKSGGVRASLLGLGVPPDNIQMWDTSAAGMSASTVATTQAMDAYYTARSAGAKSSTVFYANATNVNTGALKEIDPKEFSLYVVPDHDMGIWISDFILSKRMQYLKGAAFYQLTKTEARVTPNKLILVRDRATGKVYAGNEARQMIGLPTTSNARLHPNDHGNYDIFIQSESWNRKLVGGTGVVYWEKQGVPFTSEDIAKFTAKPAVQAPALVHLPVVTPTNKPTPSPIPVTKKQAEPTVNGKPVKFFDKREDAREYARANGKQVQDGGTSGLYWVDMPAGKRWFVFL
jgi:hypothetical protein